jgi:hypothetical protein
VTPQQCRDLQDSGKECKQQMWVMLCWVEGGEQSLACMIG